MRYFLFNKVSMFIVCIVLTGSILYFNGHDKDLSRYKIGFVYIPSIPFHARFYSQFKKLIHADERFKLTEFSPGGFVSMVLNFFSQSLDFMSLNAICGKALESDVDILVTVGNYCSRALVQLSHRRSILKPIIFAGVSDPLDLGIVDSIDVPGRNSTGFFGQASGYLVDQLSLILLVKPSLKSILLPYAVHEKYNKERIRVLKRECKQKNISLNKLPVDTLAEVLNHMGMVARNNDCITHFEDDLVAEYSCGMGKLASQYGITMFAVSPDGLNDAAVAYTPDAGAYAVPVLSLVKRILINNESPSTIPVELVDGCRTLIINTKLCAKQDLKDIDIERILHTINTDPRFEPIRGHVVVE